MRGWVAAMLLLAIAMPPVVACAADAPAKAMPPTDFSSTTFQIQPQHFDMGTVIEGEQAHARLFVRNTGVLPLHIVSVESSCGCTVGSLGSREVPPGGFTTLDISVDTTGKGEAIEKKVSVVDAMGGRADAWLTLRVVKNPHLGKMAGQGIFRGKCAVCHADPAQGKAGGAEIYAAVCIMCHGAEGKGAYAPRLRGLNPHFVRSVLQDGINSRMPAFVRRHGGPLNSRQVSTLAEWLSGLDDRR